ncbi:MAG: hypothetical protein ACXVDF_24890, partial [Ktedonobacterales bacterium]
RAATASILAQCAAVSEHDTITQAQPKNDSPMPVSHAPASRIEPQPPITPRTPVRPARTPVTDVMLVAATTAQLMPMQPLLRLHPSHAHSLSTTPLQWLPEHEAAHEVAHTQVLQTTGKPVEVRYPRDMLAISRPVIRWAERHTAVPIHARHSSILRRILRALLAPGVAAFVLKATSVILGLARVSSPLGLVLGGIEIVQLLAEAHNRWSAFTLASSYGANRVCMQC